jgi:hypothetical protein
MPEKFDVFTLSEQIGAVAPSLFQRPNIETQASLLVRHSSEIWLIPLFFMIYFVSI